MILRDYIEGQFGTTEEIFENVLKFSPGAEGYLLGSLTEFLFKEYAENLGYEVYRIKEKPDGGYNAKNDDARGDFYIRKKGSEYWYVVECKGVKSNAEKRASLTKKDSLLKFLKKYSINRDTQIIKNMERGKSDYQKAKDSRADLCFPEFRWNQENPGAGYPNLSGLWQNEEDLRAWINGFNDDLFTEQAYWDLKAPVRLLQTHMPSSRIDEIGLKSTGPLVTEFNILCVDLFLRTGKHEFVFANSQQLNHQAKAPNHLQQNYNIDILTLKDDFIRHPLQFPWYDNLDICIQKTSPTPRTFDETQIDRR